MRIDELGEKWFDVYTLFLKKYELKIAAKIAHYYRPSKIYKYFSFDSKYWRNNIFNHQIAFNVPSNFNDPLDSRWFIDYAKVLEARFREIGRDWSKDDLGGDEIFNIFISGYEEDHLYLHDLFCVSCFSSTPYSNPMWGHYAGKHTGFCLEYDVSLLPKDLQLLLPVVYVETPFDASMILDMRDIDDKYAYICPSLFKSKDWEYEKEWRIILPSDEHDSPYIVSLPGAITGVYFGLKSYGKDERQEIESWAADLNIPVYQIERSYCSFELQSDNIQDIRSKKQIKGLLI